MSQSSLPASLLRHFCFCPRIPFFKEVLGLEGPVPLWVRQGISYHEHRERLARARLPEALKSIASRAEFNVRIRGQKLGIHGIADCVLDSGRELYVLEFKERCEGLPTGTRLQIVAYAMALEECRGEPSPLGFVLSGIPGKLQRIAITPSARQEVISTLEKLRNILEAQLMPESSASEAKCTQCEYAPHCNDRG